MFYKTTLFICCLCSLPLTAFADYNTPESSPIIQSAAKTLYWTEERFKNAKPRPTPKLSRSQLQSLQKTKGISNQVLSLHVPAITPEIVGEPTRADVSKFPYSAGGKLFYTLKGTNYSCSAQFIGTLNILLTAAHCVRDEDGTWAKNVVFKRAYSNGGGQKIETQCLSTQKGWVIDKNNRYQWDYAFIKTKDESKGGAMGLKLEIPDAAFQAIGYPANYGNNQYMYKVDGTKGRQLPGLVEMNDNPMRSGNSGGAWIDKKNFAIGLNSFHEKGNNTDEWSPYFNDNVMALYNFAKNDCK